MRRMPAAVLSWTAILANAVPAAAQDLTGLSLDQLFDVEVVTASKFPQKLSEAPSAVTVVTADDIKTHGYRTVADLLRSVRGVTVAYDRSYSYLGTRGSGRPGDFNSRVLVLVDGRRLNDGIYSQGSIGTEFPIDLELIERVEYVPGPGSAIYGNSAFFGVLNIITRKGKGLGGGEWSTEAGSGNALGQRASWGRRLASGADVLVSATAYRSHGKDLYYPEYDDGAGNGGVARRMDHDRYQRLLAKYGGDELSLQAFYGHRSKGMPTASYGQQFNQPGSLSLDRYASAAATWQRALGASLDVYAHLQYAQYNYVGVFNYSTEDSGRNRDVSASRAVSAELRLMQRGWRNHKLIYGLELGRDVQRRQRNLDAAPFAVNLDVDAPKRNAAAYVQDEFHWGERTIVSTGLRFDHDSEGGHAFNPRLGLIYKVTPDLTAKLLYGTAFRAANAYERYYVTDATFYKPGPGLRSERIRTYEAIAEYFPQPALRLGASLYVYRLNHLISQATDPGDGLLYFANADSATARGLELEGEWLGKRGDRLKASASFQYARNDATRAWLTNAPRQLLKLSYSTPMWNPAARLGLEGQYTSGRATVHGASVGGFGVVNATVSGVPLGRSAELSASIYNVLDKDYADPPSDEHFDNSDPPRVLQALRQDGRAFRLNLLYRF